MEQLIQIPEGYEYSHMAEPILSNGGGVLSVMLTKKQVRCFSWFIDEYLNVSGVSTIDQMSNWFNRDQRERIANNLKQNKFSLVPWEIKIGLMKFVCDSAKINFRWAINRQCPIAVDHKIILDQKFMDSITK